MADPRTQETKVAQRVKKQTSRPAKEPGTPRRPLPAYFLWVRDNRDVIKYSKPIMSCKEFALALVAAWKEASPEVRQTYEELAKTEKEEYQVAMAAWNARMK